MEPQTPVIISQSKEAEVDTNAIKIVLLATLAILTSVASSWFMSRFFDSLNYRDAVFAGLLLGAFGVAIVLHAFFLKSRWVRGFSLGIAGLVPALAWPSLLYPNPSYTFIGGIVLFTIFVVGAAREGSQKLLNSMDVRFFDTIRSVSVKFVTGVLILTGAFSYAYFIEHGNLSEKIGKSVVHSVLFVSNPIVSAEFPNVSLSTQTAGDFFKTLGEDTFETVRKQSLSGEYQGVRGDFSNLSPIEKSKIISEATHKIKKVFEDRIGSVPDDMKISDVVYRIVERFVLDLDPAARRVLAVTVLFSILAAIKGISFFAVWALQFISFLVLKFLIATGFARITSETRVREFVILP